VRKETLVKWIGLAICVVLLSLPSATAALPSPPVEQAGRERPAVVPLPAQIKVLRARVVKLEARVARQQTQIDSLRVLVCLQLPSC